MRTGSFRRSFDSLGIVITKDDASLASSVLDPITDLAKTSPFKDLKDVATTTANLKTPDKVWELYPYPPSRKN